MAKLHKSTPSQATSPVLACGSCLPGMVSLAGSRGSRRLGSSVHNSVLWSDCPLLWSCAQLRTQSFMLQLAHRTSQMISPRWPCSTHIASLPYKQLSRYRAAGPCRDRGTSSASSHRCLSDSPKARTDRYLLLSRLAPIRVQFELNREAKAFRGAGCSGPL